MGLDEVRSDLRSHLRSPLFISFISRSFPKFAWGALSNGDGHRLKAFIGGPKRGGPYYAQNWKMATLDRKRPQIQKLHVALFRNSRLFIRVPILRRKVKIAIWARITRRISNLSAAKKIVKKNAQKLKKAFPGK